MARRGNFGRSPRPAASLTNTIISIAREMQQQRDQNLVDAWQKGGTFEGQKATDELVLAHWKKRASEVSKDDPLYNTYQNAYMEYDYSIHESKMTVAYAQHKINDNQASAFYTNWAKKVPKNSEFYRVLQRDAAQYLNRSKANGIEAAKRAKELAYQHSMDQIDAHSVKPGEHLLDIFKNIATRGLRPNGGDPLIDPQNGDLTQFGPEDVGEMLGMIAGASSPTYKEQKDGKSYYDSAAKHGTSAILYHDPITGKPVTGLDVINQMKKLDPKFSGVLDTANMTEYLHRMSDGYGKQAALAEKTGHMTDATNARKNQSYVSEVGREVKAWPVEQTILTSRDAMLAVVNNHSSTPQEIADAIGQHRGNLERYLKDPAIAANDIMINKIRAEIAGRNDVNSVAEDFTGLGGSTKPSDIGSEQSYLDRSIQQIDLVRGAAGLPANDPNKVVWTTGEYKNGEFVPAPGGSTIGAATQQHILDMSGGVPTKTVVITDKQGRANTVTLMGVNVLSHVTDPTTGLEIPGAKGTNPIVGQVYDYPDGARGVAFKDGKGGTLYNVDSNPYGLPLVDSGSTFDLHITAPTNGAEASAFGLTSKVNPTTGMTTWEVDPVKAAFATDQAHAIVLATGVGDPSRDSRSLTIAKLQASPDGEKIINSLKSNPDFNKVVGAEIAQATGAQPVLDPKTGALLGYQPNDKYNKAIDNLDAILYPRNGNQTPQDLTDRIGVSAADLPHANTAQQVDLFASHQSAMDADIPVQPLATTTLAGSGVANGFSGGTLNKGLAPSGYDHGSSGIQIDLSKTSLKVPGLDPSFALPNPNQTPHISSASTSVNTTLLPGASTSVGGGSGSGSSSSGYGPRPRAS